MMNFKNIKENMRYLPDGLRFRTIAAAIIFLLFPTVFMGLGVYAAVSDKDYSILIVSILLAVLILFILVYLSVFSSPKNGRNNSIMYYEAHPVSYNDAIRFIDGLKVAGMIKEVTPELLLKVKTLLLNGRQSIQSITSYDNGIDELRNINYHFDTEIHEPKNMYKTVLNELAKISNGKFEPVKIKDSCGGFNAVSRIEFCIKDNKYETTVNTKDDWLDLSVIDFVNKALKKEGISEKFYVTVLSQDVVVYFLNKEQFDFLSWYMWLNSNSPFIRGFNSNQEI